MPAGSRWVRVATDHVGGTEGSASSAPRRFSPVLDATGRRLPVLYAGENLTCALGETVFHDLDDDPGVPGVVFRADLLTLRASFLAVSRAIVVADLRDAALIAAGTHHEQVVNTAPYDYPVTRLWGQHVWDRTRCAGIVWASRRTPGCESVMLFLDPPSLADRSRALAHRGDLTMWRPPLPLHDGRGLGIVLTAASDRNVADVL
jgi:hypothetical protein